ncbi:MAG TPA: NUDIX domain-containing protein [Candidatus Limnocylindrales bacterium]|nr:NUDIX domain-containing protein [Candidatus Limnocylindrales bacterium]
MTDPAVTEPLPPGRTRLGSYSLCIDEAGRLLLARLSAVEVEYGAWTLPGGGVDFGEHPDAAAIRELEEETGLVGEIEGIAGIFSHLYERSRWARGADLHFLGVVYRMRVVGGDLRDEVDGTTDAAGWFSRDEIADLRLVYLAKFGASLAFPGIEL